LGGEKKKEVFVIEKNNNGMLIRRERKGRGQKAGRGYNDSELLRKEKGKKKKRCRLLRESQGRPDLSFNWHEISTQREEGGPALLENGKKGEKKKRPS